MNKFDSRVSAIINLLIPMMNVLYSNILFVLGFGISLYLIYDEIQIQRIELKYYMLYPLILFYGFLYVYCFKFERILNPLGSIKIRKQNKKAKNDSTICFYSHMFHYFKKYFKIFASKVVNIVCKIIFFPKEEDEFIFVAFFLSFYLKFYLILVISIYIFVSFLFLFYILWLSRFKTKNHELSKSKRKWLYRKFNCNPSTPTNLFYFLCKWNVLLISSFYLNFALIQLFSVFQNALFLVVPKLIFYFNLFLFFFIEIFNQKLNFCLIKCSFILKYHPITSILIYVPILYLYFYFVLKCINKLQSIYYMYNDNLTKEMIFSIRARLFEVVYEENRKTHQMKLSDLLHQVSLLFLYTLDKNQIDLACYDYLNEQEGRLFVTSYKTKLIGPRSLEHEPQDLIYIAPVEIMNVFMKYDDEEMETKTFQLFPFETISDLLFLYNQQVYISTDNNITFRGKCLLDPKTHHYSLQEMGIQDGSHIWVRCNRLKAGARRQKRSHEEMSDGVLSTSSRFPKRKRKQVEFYQAGDNHLSDNLQPQPPSYSFPIKFYQKRSTDAQSFSHLEKKEFYEFQCLLYWDIVHKFDSLRQLRSPSATYKTFLKEKVLSLQQVIDLKNDWTNQKVDHTFYFCDMRAYNETPISNLFDFAVTFVLLMRQNPNLNVWEFFDSIWSDFDSKNNRYSSNHIFGIDSKKLNLNFLVQSFLSIQNSIGAMKEKLGSTKEHARFISNMLSSMMLTNPAAAELTDFQLAELTNSTKYFITRAKETVEGFQNQTQNNFDRNYADREYFTSESKKIMSDWWLTETIPAGGTITVQKRTKKGKTPVPIPVRYIPCTVSEFYQRFKADEEYGKRIRRKSDNKLVVPSFSTFRRYRPFHVKFLGKYRTGFCSTCMQFDEYVKTFRTLVEENCNCKSINCLTFQHKEGCDFDDDDHCEHGYCEECYCEPCQNCNSTSISKSERFKPFMDLTTCAKYVNMENSTRNFPTLKCMHRECDDCFFDFDEEFWGKFCTSSTFSALMNQNKMVETKVWAKKTVSTSDPDKKDYQVDVLVDHEMTTAEFLEEFHDFLNKKYGFIWHYSTRHNQRIHYNKMIRHIKKGEYGDEAMMFVVDYAGDWKMRLGPKESSNQFYKTKKCRILGLIEFSWIQLTGADSNSSFVFTEPNVPKTASVSIKFLKQRINFYKEKNPNLKYIHIWSDGSCKEFLNRKMFGNFGEQLPDGITVIWHFFCNMHGKNICDSEFSGLKSKLDRVVKERGSGFQEVEDVFNFCQEHLNSQKWKRKDGGLKSRTFFYQKLPVTNFSTDCEEFVDVKMFRNVMWQKRNGIVKFYRRNNSCSCIKCSLPKIDDSEVDVCDKKDLHGTWVKEEIWIQPNNKENVMKFYKYFTAPPKKSNKCESFNKKKKKLKNKDDDPSESFDPLRSEEYGWAV